MTDSDPIETSGYYRSMAAVLDSLDAAVYVADMKDGEMLFMNRYGRSHFGNDYRGRKCWEVLQEGQSGPCSFCTNARLVDTEGNPTAPYVWEFQNTRNGRWYQCRDQAIHWGDGRLVRMEIATDITDRKHMELEIEEAKRRAEALAHTDELTGLHNRRAFFAHGEQLLQDAMRLGHSVAALMLDLDRFKYINDVYGHAAGDKVLKSVARALRPLIRTDDVLGRLGGEEFAVLMNDVSEVQALDVAERLRMAVADCVVHHGSHIIRPTTSIGIAVFEQPTSLSEMLSHADAALLRAKRCGRDRVEYSNALLQTGTFSIAGETLSRPR
jgi:diguanylate cyclase (GGDEF)-like protein